MATYVNDLRLKEIGTGESSGTWGTETNVNLELIGEALGFGTEAITTNADTHTTTVADGSTDPGRAMYIKYTGTLDSACTITIGPNTINRLHYIENATSGSQNIIISQGSGANITIPAGDTKAVYLDGAGSGAAVVDVFASLSAVDLKVQDDLTVTDDATIGGTLGVTGILTCTDDIIIGDGKTIGSASDVDAITIASNGQVTFTQTLIGTALDISGDIDVDGTANLDIVDIDGATNIAAAVTMATNNKIQFRDDAIHISSTTDGQLDLVADTEIQIAATTIDINGAINASGEIIAASLDISGDIDVDGTSNLDIVDIDGAVDMASTLQVDGNVTTGGTFNIGSSGSIGVVSTDRVFIATADGLGLQFDKDNNRIVPVAEDGSTYNNNVSLGSSSLEFKNLALTGTVTAASLDISGNIDVDGTTNLDVVDIDGAVDFASTTAHAGNATFADGAGALFGAGSDLQIYHDGSNSYIQSATGNLNITTAGGAEFALTAANNGAVSLFHDGSTKLATASGGVTVTGNLQATSLTVGTANDEGEALNIRDAGHTGHGAANTVSLASFGETVSGNTAGIFLGSMTNENTAVVGARTASGNIGFQTFNGSAWGERMRIDNIGRVTKPAQPAFLVRPSSTQSNLAANGTQVQIAFGTEIFDQGSNFASNVFTAPVTGKYQLNITLYLTGFDVSASYYAMYITTSNRNFELINSGSVSGASDPAYRGFGWSCLADMDANDTAEIHITQSGGAAQTDVTIYSRFSGFLAC